MLTMLTNEIEILNRQNKFGIWAGLNRVAYSTLLPTGGLCGLTNRLFRFARYKLMFLMDFLTVEVDAGGSSLGALSACMGNFPYRQKDFSS